MNLIETFGRIVENRSQTDPDKARRILKTGWQVFQLKNRFLPDRRLSPSGVFLAKMLMEMMLAPLNDPGKSAIVSMLTPCELLQLFGLNVYSAEAYSTFIAASGCGGVFLRKTEAAGLPETLCSYHRVFLGAAESGILPKPKCIISTNLACDANQLTFKHLASYFQVPHFTVDVPYEPCAPAVDYVAGQLKELYQFLKEVTGEDPGEDKLREITDRSRETMAVYKEYQKKRGEQTFLQNLETPLYEFGAVNILRGSPQSLQYCKMALQDAERSSAYKGLKLLWIHTIPYWMPATRKLFTFNKDIQLVGMDITNSAFFNTESPGQSPDPYTVMAQSLVYSSLNGNADRRIDHALKTAKETGAHGAVWFSNWGCRRTMIAADQGKKRLEAEGIPVLILNGDSVDSTGGGSEQTGTRLEAFIEMLQAQLQETHTGRTL